MKYSLVSIFALMGSLITAPLFAEVEPATEVADERVEPDKGGWHGKHCKRWKNMSEDERAAIKEKRKDMREKIAKMSPQERKAFREQRLQKKLDRMTPEQREKFQAKRAEIIERFDKDGDGQLNDEERAAAKEAWKSHRKNHLKHHSEDADHS